VNYDFSEGGKVHSYRLSETEVQSRKGILTLAKGQSVRKYRQERKAEPDAAPVFYDVRELPSPKALAEMTSVARERRLIAARRVMTSTLLVKMEPSMFGRLASTGATGSEASLVKGWMLVRYASPFAALEATDWMLQGGGWEFIPVFSRQMEKRQVLQRQVSDPLYPKQWHLAAERFNINMRNVWDSVTGKGINMAIVDDGLEIRHEDLTNAYPLETGYHRNFNDLPKEDPSPQKASENHGTNSAGLAAAAGFNNTGVIGVAPEARLMGLRLIAGGATDEDSGNALAWQPAGLVTHVSSNSWGPTDDGKDLGRVGVLQMAGMEKAATTYRNGLGTVFAISCGNGRQSGDDSSYDGFSGSRFGIAVAAVNRDGVQSSYSENGMNVAISALGGEFDPPGVMWTTNNSGQEAFDEKAGKFPTSEAPMNYSDAFNGTSSAAPQISGTAALMIEKNPRLGYRDVKEILIRTANREGLNGSDEFTTNGAGIPFSHSFGAGLVNVSAAVERASTWENLGPLVSAELSNRDGGMISEDGLATVRSFDFSALRKIRVEHVELVVNVKHGKRGDLAFGITAPSGMISIANPRSADDGANFEDYLFTSVRHWGETSSGTWRVSVLDANANGVTGEVLSVTLRVYGTALP
jgi:hypothetical protein